MMIKQNSKLITILHVAIILIGFVNSIITDDITFNAFESLPFFANFQYKIITMPELYIAMLILLAYTIIIYLYDTITSKKTEKNDNANTKKVMFISNTIVICLSVICVILSSATLITTENIDIPEISDGKYLDVHDFGIADKVTEKGYNHSGIDIPNKITVKKTVSSQLTLTQEYYHIGNKHFIVYQDILEYRNDKTALKVAELLSKDEHKNYQEYTADGFEKVYVSSENLISVINNTVYRITFISTDKSIDTSTEKLLDAILENYNNTIKMSD